MILFIFTTFCSFYLLSASIQIQKSTIRPNEYHPNLTFSYTYTIDNQFQHQDQKELNSIDKKRNLPEIQIEVGKSAISTFEERNRRILTEIIGCAVYDDPQTNLTCKQCLSEYTLNPQQSCSPCSQQCSQCIYNQTSNLTQCVKCITVTNPNYRWSDIILYNKYCYSQSLIGIEYLQNWPVINYINLGNIMVKCPSSCFDRCYFNNNSIKCLYVKPGFSWNGEFITQNVSLCINNCSYCSQNFTKCTGCTQGYYLQNNTCFRCSYVTLNCFSCQPGPKYTCKSCLSGYFFDGQCLPCFQNCKTCSNLTNCEVCLPGYIFYQNLPNTSIQCIPCIEGCSKCILQSQTTVCTQCLSGFYSSIPSQKSVCFPCPENCLTCTDQNILIVCVKCLPEFLLADSVCKLIVSNRFDYVSQPSSKSCYVGYEFINGSCVLPLVSTNTSETKLACGKNEYFSNFTCLPVAQTVDNCIEYNAVSCISCKLGYYPGYVSSNKKIQCLHCPIGCKQCSTFLRCQITQNGYYLQAYNSGVRLLRQCSSNCKTCIEFKDKCTSCSDGFLLSLSRKCIEKIKFNMRIQLNISYDNILSLLQSVHKSIQATQSSVFAIFELVSLQKASLLSTNLTYSVYGTKPQIQNLQKNFSEYFLNYSQKGSFNYVQNITILSVAISNVIYCPNRQKFDSVSQTCVEIQIPNCQLYEDFYDNGITCQVCQSGFILSQDHRNCSANCTALGLLNCAQCLYLFKCDRCMQGYVQIGANACIQISIPNCIKAYMNALSQIKCRQCSFNSSIEPIYRIINNRCAYRQVETSSIISYRYRQNASSPIILYYIQCMEGCKVCNSLYSCEVCHDGYKIVVQPVMGYMVCVLCTGEFINCQDGNLSCVPGYILDSLTNSCNKCQTENCLLCSQSNVSKCIQCFDGFYLASETQCSPCLEGCQNCTSATNCFQCQAGYMVFSSVYYSPAPLSCVRCPQGCGSCTMDQCLGCYPGFYTDLSSPNQCTEQLPNCWLVSSYPDDPSCMKCFPGYVRMLYGSRYECFKKINHCQTYNFSDSFKTCSQCYFGYEVDEVGLCRVRNSQNAGQEIFPCDKGVFLETGPLCTKCTLNDTNCLNCYYSICLQCKDRYYIEQYKNNSTSNFCQPCTLEGCLNCQSSRICRNCSEGYFMKNSTNLSVGICVKCDPNCLTCYQKSYLCTSCPQKYQLTSSRSCIGLFRSNFTLKLIIEKNYFLSDIKNFLTVLVGMVSDDKNLTTEQKLKSIQIYSIKKGSTIINGAFTSTSAEYLNATLSNYNKQIQTGSILSMPVSGGTVTVTLSPQVVTESNTKYIIIAAVIDGVVGILLILGVCFIVRKKRLHKQIMEKNIQSEIKKKKGNFDERKTDSSAQKNGSSSENNIIGKKDGINWDFY